MMRGSARAILLIAGLLVGLAFPTVGRSAGMEQFFASIFWENKKIGQVHIRLTRGETGEIEELRARASVSMLGIKLYEFTQDLHQSWTDGELQKMQGGPTTTVRSTKLRSTASRASTRVASTVKR